MSKRKRSSAILNNSAEDDSQNIDVFPFTTTEFLFIRDNFKSSDLACMEKMFSIIQLWHWRHNDEKHPIIVIDLAKLILQGLIFDQRHVIDKKIEIPDAEETTQLVYGSCLARVVNYINNVCKTVLHPKSELGNMYDSASSVGIPGWIVRLRHDVVHVNLPSLEDLRKAAYFLREWLFNVHFSQPIEIAFLQLGSNVQKPLKKKSNVSSQKIQDLLQEYCRMKMKKETTEDYRIRLNRLLLDIKYNLFADSKLFIDAIANKIIIETKDRMTAMKFQCNDEFFWKIPLSWKAFWEDLIHMVFECGLVGNLMVSFAQNALVSEESLWKIQYAAWLSHLIKKLKATGRVAANQTLTLIARNMIKSKQFHRKENFVYILDSMHPKMGDEQRTQMLREWDESDANTCDEMSFYMDEADCNDSTNFGLVSSTSPLGLMFEQTKDSLNLYCSNVV